jgi:Mn2+/Fe2+ NRAMP family transporter
MSAAASSSVHSTESRRPATSPRSLLRSLIGFIGGFILGVVVVGVIWFVAFAQSFGGGQTIDMPGFIAASGGAESVSTSIGPLLLLTPFGVGLLGSAVGVLVGYSAKKTRSPRER